MKGRFKSSCVLLLLWAAPAGALHGGEQTFGPPPGESRKDVRLADFYKKCLVADGFPIVSSAKVSDYGLLEARYLIDKMLAGRDDIRKALIKHRIRFAVMAPTEFTCDIPEHSDLKPPGYWNKRARGLGATRIRPAVSCGEENLLQFPGDPYVRENILIHEFSHAIHEIGLREVDKTFDARLRAAYDEAMKEGLWKKTYAATNRAEYWAEGVQSWFHCNRTNDGQHNHVNTRAEVTKYDPRLAKLLGEVFKDNDWIYTAPRDRKEPLHLAGYDRSEAPRFVWPKEVLEAFQKAGKKK